MAGLAGLSVCGDEKTALVPKICFETKAANSFRGTTQIAPASRPDAPYGAQQPLRPDAAGFGEALTAERPPSNPRLRSHRTWRPPPPARTARRLSEGFRLRPSPSSLWDYYKKHRAGLSTGDFAGGPLPAKSGGRPKGGPVLFQLRSSTMWTFRWS